MKEIDIKNKIIKIKKILIDKGGYISGFQTTGRLGVKGTDISPTYHYEISRDDMKFLETHKSFNPKNEIQNILGEDFMEKIQSLYEPAMEAKAYEKNFEENKYYKEWKKLDILYDDVKNNIDYTKYVYVNQNIDEENKINNPVNISYEKARIITGYYIIKNL